MDPLDTLRAHGWRMRAPFCFVRRGECLWCAGNGVWRWLRRDDRRRVAGRNLADAVWLVCLRATPRTAQEYAPVMEAVR